MKNAFIMTILFFGVQSPSFADKEATEAGVSQYYTKCPPNNKDCVHVDKSETITDKDGEHMNTKYPETPDNTEQPDAPAAPQKGDSADE